MKKKSQPKTFVALSPEAGSLLQEAEEKAAAWLKDIPLLAQKLLLFSAEEREGFFLGLLQKENDQMFTLLEALWGREEQLDPAA